MAVARRKLKQLPSFSRIGLAMQCGHPWSGAYRWPGYVPNEAADRGNAISKIGECCSVWGDFPRTGDTYKDSCGESMLAQLEADGAAWRWTEVAFAYNPRTRTCRVMDSFKAPRKPGELVGSPDVVFGRADGSVVVRDWKTGTYARQIDPAESWQLRALALCVAALCKASSVRVELGLLDESGALLIRGANLNAFEHLIPSELALEGMVDEFERGKLWPRPGAHCWESGFCPIISECSVSRATLATVAGGGEHELTSDIDSPAHAAWMLERIAVAKHMLDQLRLSINDYSDDKPIPMSGGRVYQKQATKRETIVVDEALVRLLDAKGLAGAVKRRVTKSALEDLLKPTLDGSPLAPAVRQLMDELRAIDAVRVSNSSSYEARKPPKEKKKK